jgi:hypothetical protein
MKLLGSTKMRSGGSPVAAGSRCVWLNEYMRSRSRGCESKRML